MAVLVPPGHIRVHSKKLHQSSTIYRGEGNSSCGNPILVNVEEGLGNINTNNCGPGGTWPYNPEIDGVVVNATTWKGNIVGGRGHKLNVKVFEGSFNAFLLGGDLNILKGSITLPNTYINHYINKTVEIYSSFILEDTLLSITNNERETRFKENPDYALASYWNNRNITVNGLKVKNPDITSEVNASGLNSLNLGKFYDAYGGSQSFDFIIERYVDGMDNDFIQVDAFTKPLSSSLQWLDWNTVLKKNSYYRVGFRKSLGVEPVNKDFQDKQGFIFVEPFTHMSRSEGYGVDADAPNVLQFTVAGGLDEVQIDNADVVLKANDNRSDRGNLVANITVNGVTYYWNGTKFVIADNEDHMTPFPDKMTGLPLGGMGSKFIVASVRDEAGNVATSTATILYSISSSPSSPEDVKPEDITDGDGEPLVFGAYKGQQVLFCKTDNVILKYDQTKYADSKIKFNFQGFAWSSWDTFNRDLNLALSKQEGLVKIRYQIIKPNGEIIKDELLNILVDSTPPTISSIKGNKGATAGTAGSSFTAIVSAKDNISKNLKYRYSVNGGNFTESKELTGGKATITLSSGVNNIEIEIMDEVGNAATHQLTVFGL